MLIFVFSALAAALDLIFKRWIVLVLPLHEQISLIPGVIGLTHLHNTGAAFGLFAGHRWELVAIKFVAIVVLVFILLRYNESFWGRLGLAAILGGAGGNFIDRLFNGYVVDMFELYFINFAIFNIADIFITGGAALFVIMTIIYTVKDSDDNKEAMASAHQDSDEGEYEFLTEGAYSEDIQDNFTYENNSSVFDTAEMPHADQQAAPVTSSYAPLNSTVTSSRSNREVKVHVTPIEPDEYDLSASGALHRTQQAATPEASDSFATQQDLSETQKREFTLPKYIPPKFARADYEPPNFIAPELAVPESPGSSGDRSGTGRHGKADYMAGLGTNESLGLSENIDSDNSALDELESLLKEYRLDEHDFSSAESFDDIDLSDYLSDYLSDDDEKHD